jgi:alpha-glucosidase
MSTTERPWWRGAVIYQIYPRSFLDTNGDGIGDLPGVIAGLDYIRDLDVDAIWLSPIMVSPMCDYGYDVADYRRVDPLFGADADLDRLLSEAHRRGLKVILDMVLPHTSDRHPWFEESRRGRDNPRADFYVWADPRRDGSPPNNWLSVFGGPAWQWEARRRQYYLHHFLKSQPNLNWHNPTVVEAMMDNVRFWMDKGVDGLRLDAITTLISDRDLRDNPPVASGSMRFDLAGLASNPFVMQEHLFDRDRPEVLSVLARLRAEVDHYQDRYMMAEVADVDAAVVGAKYTRGAGLLHSFYGFQLARQDLSAELLHRVVSHAEAHLADGWMTYTLGNHDTPRAVSRFGALPHLSGDPGRLARLLMAFVLSLRGGACIYQGDELGLGEAELAFEELRDPWGIAFWPDFKGRDGCRTPLPWRAGAPHAGFTRGAPWLPVCEAHRELAIDRQEADPGSLLHAYRRFLAFRRGHPALVTGEKALRRTEGAVFAMERIDGPRRVLCAFNLSNRPETIGLEPGWAALEGHGFEATFDGRTAALPAFGAFFAGRTDEATQSTRCATAERQSCEQTKYPGGRI